MLCEYTSSVDGVHNIKDISGIFADKYCQLYSSVVYEENKILVFMDNVENYVRNTCISSKCEHHHSINVSDVNSH